MGHADVLGDEADRGVRRVEEPGAGRREFLGAAGLEPDRSVGSAIPATISTVSWCGWSPWAETRRL
jgi:hypothetical protein